MSLRHIETEIEIEASASRVWSLLTDFIHMPSWNPFIKEISGNLAEGETLSVRVAPPGKGAMQFKPVIVALRPERELRWVGRVFARGLFDGEHYFQLEPLDQDRTRLKHGEIFSGILVPVLSWMLPATQTGFEAMNGALKEQAEQN